VLPRSRSHEVLPGFIVFEGLDGAGTTTQAHRLVERLSRYTPAEFTCEPTGFATGALIRTLLHGPEYAQPETLALLFAADRHEHLYRPEQGIRALLAAGKTVVCDRYLFSSLAYQGSLTDFEFVARLNAPFPLPEHLIFIDTPLNEAFRRMEGRGNRDTLEQMDVQEQVAPRYRAVIREFRETDEVRSGAMKITEIDGSRPPDDVFREVCSAVLYRGRSIADTQE
jgi:dTMP kinase